MGLLCGIDEWLYVLAPVGRRPRGSQSLLLTIKGSPPSCTVLPSLLLLFFLILLLSIILILRYLFVFKLRLCWFTTLSKFHVCNIIFWLLCTLFDFCIVANKFHLHASPQSWPPLPILQSSHPLPLLLLLTKSEENYIWVGVERPTSLFLENC